MAELFMECEEEELEPWQQKSKPIVVDDDDDDDEPIFVGEILSSKPTSTYILNRVNPSSSRTGLQNGVPKTGTVPVSPGFQSALRPATSTLAVQPQPRVSGISGTAQAVQRPPLSGCPSPQEATKTSSGLSQPAGRAGTAPSIARNLSIPVLAQSAFRPVATVTAQPATFNRGHAPGLAFGSRQNPGGSPCQSGSPVNTAGLSKRPSMSEADSTSPKKAKADEMGPGMLSIHCSSDSSLLLKGATSTNPFPQSCPKCNIHFNLLEPLKNHIKYCCPEMLPAFLGGIQPDCLGGTPGRLIEAESGKLIMLVNDFYYGKHEGNLQQVCQEQKTHTTYKCASCMKLLKSNIRFMNHMKHHLELEKQNSESWESHTTCQHCYRQFPTPFQLQCHIESTHTPHECSTICKICELSFETEQVLLQHMKDNHKPGEMPYVCQVCSYRSSAFSDVEKHFRTVHENTKNLLCPFCLKVIKIGSPYMHHFMRHQKKGVHRCTKCRLQFLTCKEKLEHKSQHHRTFKKPAQLEGLPPGTKVTIRASVGSLPPATLATSPVNAHAFPLQPSPPAEKVAKSYHHKASANKAKAKAKPLSLQKKPSAGSHSATSSSASASSSSGKKNNNKIANTALSRLKCPNIQKCIECNSDIRTFARHFPAYVRCGLCRYKTSCSKAYVNHMMSFHSARRNKRFWIYRTHSEGLRGMTVVCLDCEFLSDDSALDKMATHLNDNDTHTCHIIMEHVPDSLNCLSAADISDQLNKVLINNKSDEKSQGFPKARNPEEQPGTSGSQSSRIEEVVKEEEEDLEKQKDEAALLTDREEKKPPVEEQRLAPQVSAVEKPVASGKEKKPPALGVQGSGEASAAGDQEEPGIESVCVPGGPGGSPGSAEGGEAEGHHGAEAEKESEGSPSLLAAEGSSTLEPGGPSSKGSAGEEEGKAKAPAGEAKGPPFEDSLWGQPDPSSGSGSPACPEEPVKAAHEGSVVPLEESQGLGSPGGAGCEGKACLSVPGDAPHSGLSVGCSDHQPDSSGKEGLTDFPVTPGGAGLAAESLGSAPASASEGEPPTRLSPDSGDPGKPRPEEETHHDHGEKECSFLPTATTAAVCGEGKPSSLSVPEPPSLPTPLPSPGSMVAAGGIEWGGQGSQAGLDAPGCKESASGSQPEESLLSGLSEAASPPPSGPLEESAPPNPLESQIEGGGGGCSASAEEEKEQLQRSLAEGGTGTPGGAVGGEKTSSEPGGQGEPSCPDKEEEVLEEEAQVAEAPLDDPPLEEGEGEDRPEDVDRPEREVGFEQFLSRRGEASLANSDGSEQGSAQLEPLTPSELLEHEATEILQKGGGASSSSAPGGSGSGVESEHTEGSSSREGSPGPEPASGEPTEEEDAGGRPQQQP